MKKEEGLSDDNLIVKRDDIDHDEIIKEIKTIGRNTFELNEGGEQIYYYKQIIDLDDKDTDRYICFCKDSNIRDNKGEIKTHIANGFLSKQYKIVRTGILVDEICKNLNCEEKMFFHIPFHCIYWINTDMSASLFLNNNFVKTFKMIINSNCDIDKIDVKFSIIVYNSYNGTRSLKISYSPKYIITIGDNKHELRDLFILSNVFHTIKHLKTDISDISNKIFEIPDILIKNANILKTNTGIYDSMVGLITHLLSTKMEKSAFLGTCDSVPKEHKNLLVLSILTSKFLSCNFKILTYNKISDLFLSYFKSLDG